MSDGTLTHYAVSTGLLSAELVAAEITLRIALEANRTEAGLRRSVTELLASIERANVEHKTRSTLALAPHFGGVPCA